MSLHRSSQLPGGFQIRHSSLGVFQGTAVGLAFWHPTSDMPEYGLCRFHSRDDAQAYVQYFCSEQCPEPMRPEELTVEPFDHGLHQRLISDNPMPSAWDAPP